MRCLRRRLRWTRCWGDVGDLDGVLVGDVGDEVVGFEGDAVEDVDNGLEDALILFPLAFLAAFDKDAPGFSPAQCFAFRVCLSASSSLSAPAVGSSAGGTDPSPGHWVSEDCNGSKRFSSTTFFRDFFTMCCACNALTR